MEKCYSSSQRSCLTRTAPRKRLEMDASAFLYYIHNKLGLKAIDTSLFNPKGIEKISDNPDTAIAIMLLSDYLKNKNKSKDGLLAEGKQKALEFIQVWKAVIVAPEILKELNEIESSLKG